MGRLNKPAKEGYRYRSPNQTNANDALPNLREDVGASQRADNERIRRSFRDSTPTDRTPTALDERNRRNRQEAGGRAMTRTGGRAGLVGLAGAAGEALGREIDRRTGASGKIAEAVARRTIDPKVDRMLGRGPARETAAPSSPEEQQAAEPNVSYSADRTPARKTARPARSAPSPQPTLREGANANISDETRGRARDAMRQSDTDDSGTNYAAGGPVKRGRGDGIAQRGLTKGKFI